MNVVKCCIGNLMYFHGPELTLDEISKNLDIDPSRIHKTHEVSYHIHDITNEEIAKIKSMTLGGQKSTLLGGYAKSGMSSCTKEEFLKNFKPTEEVRKTITKKEK